MQIHKILPKGFGSNTYLLTENGRDAILIDPSQPRVLNEAEKLKLCVKYVLLTHGHFDHIGGCAALQRAGAKIGCKRGEEEIALRNNLGEVYGTGPVEKFCIDFTFEDGEVLDLLGIKLKVIATPGHTRGGVCFQTEDKLFTGDTLFCGDVGRTDGPTGSEEELQESLQKLMSLKGDFEILPGHGKASTLDWERKHNPYLSC